MSTLYCFLDQYAHVISYNVIDFSRDFGKLPYDHQAAKTDTKQPQWPSSNQKGLQVAKMICKFGHQNDDNLAVHPILHQVPTESPL
ncbi:hypothetical protein TNCV_3604871 [Trichonephila clavipes]|nr:hypothetical protein TNCV_3604871 [Trichonephila clavipes]